MLYKKNYLSTLSDELFRSPTSEYRAAPFWAWNCKLEEDELLRQPLNPPILLAMTPFCLYEL